MKSTTRLTTALMAAMLLLPFTAYGDEDGKSSAQNPNEIFKRLDANGDGKLAANEVPNERKPFFERLLRLADNDNDGLLTENEFAEGLKPQAQNTGKQKSVKDAPNGKPAKKVIQANAKENYRNRFAQFAGAILKADANKDGSVTENEVSGKLLKIFRILLKLADKNNDGALSRAELAQLKTSQAQPPSFQSAKAKTTLQKSSKQGINQNPKLAAAGLFRLLDTDENGKLTRDELTKAPELIGRLDRDADGALSSDELLPRTSQKATKGATAKVLPKKQAAESGNVQKKRNKADPDRLGRAYLKKLDRNQDGKVTRGELPDGYQKRFDQLDTNKDGELSLQELSALSRSKQAAQTGIKGKRPANGKR